MNLQILVSLPGQQGYENHMRFLLMIRFCINITPLLTGKSVTNAFIRLSREIQIAHEGAAVPLPGHGFLMNLHPHAALCRVPQVMIKAASSERGQRNVKMYKD